MQNESVIEQLKERLNSLHSGDQKQLDVIFSKSKKLIVEAPAGYGKTKTMISKIAYLLASNQVAEPKKILALTFSINAAYKIKKDVSEQLPKLMQIKGLNPLNLNDKLFISNYHGFCRHILKVYGYLLHPNLKSIDTLISIDDSKTELLTSSLSVSEEVALFFSGYNDAIKNIKIEDLNKNFNKYIKGIIEIFLPKNYVSHNSIIILVLQLFIKYPELLKFYQKYFPVIIIDEFQDTNTLSWALLRQLITKETLLIVMGDTLQRIYGFIGAIPDLILKAKQEYSMEIIKLEKNYRFKDNPQMLLIDKNIRLNAENPKEPNITANVNINEFLSYKENQHQEAEAVVERIQHIAKYQNQQDYKIAVLVSKRGPNIDKIIEIISKNNISYFYGLFSEDDPNYSNFHKQCESHLLELLAKDFRLSEFTLNKFYSYIDNAFKSEKNKPTIISLLELLSTFFIRIVNNYSFLSVEDKIMLIKDTFANKTLKQNMEYVNKNIIISTIHGAKGLEWDYVLIPDMEMYSIPSFGLCKPCRYKKNCGFVVNDINEKSFLEELSVFYVAVTRARKQTFFSASKISFKQDGSATKSNISCFLKLPGFIINLE